MNAEDDDGPPFDRMMTSMADPAHDEHPAPPPADTDTGGVADLAAVSEAAEARRGPVRQRRRSMHPLLVAAIVGGLALIVLGVLYGRVYAKRSALLRVQQACLDYNPPADQVVYDESPARATELLARGGGEYSPVPTSDPITGAETRPAESPVAGHIPPAWREMRRWAMPLQPEPTGAVLFLHERKTHVGGKQVLVCVEADRAARQLRITLVHPGASTLDPAPMTDLELAPPPQPDLVVMKAGDEPFEGKLPKSAGERADLRFFAGQIDPNDPTRFNLPFEFNGQRGELDCWLEDERAVFYVERRFELK